jgi:hypothetical protein
MSYETSPQQLCPRGLHVSRFAGGPDFLVQQT